MSLPQDMLNVLKKVNSYPHCFYGKFARLGLEITMNGSLRVGIAPSLNNNPGRPVKGVPSYNNELNAFFTLNPSDVKTILVHLPLIKDNKYENPNPKCDPQYKTTFQLNHFDNKNKTSSIFRITNPKNEKNKLTIFIKSIEGKTCSYQLANDVNKNIYELFFFESVLRNVAENGVYNNLLFKSQMSMFKSALFEILSDNSSNNSGGGYRQQNNNNYRGNSGGGYQQNYQPQHEVDMADHMSDSVGYDEIPHDYFQQDSNSGNMSMDDIDNVFSSGGSSNYTQDADFKL